jgi:hypothetical protein
MNCCLLLLLLLISKKLIISKFSFFYAVMVLKYSFVKFLNAFIFVSFCSQLDNNNFDGTSIPRSYSNMSNLLKL